MNTQFSTKTSIPSVHGSVRNGSDLPAPSRLFGLQTVPLFNLCCSTNPKNASYSLSRSVQYGVSWLLIGFLSAVKWDPMVSPQAWHSDFPRVVVWQCGHSRILSGAPLPFPKPFAELELFSFDSAAFFLLRWYSLWMNDFTVAALGSLFLAERSSTNRKRGGSLAGLV